MSRFELGPSPAAGGVADGDRGGFSLPHNDDKTLATGEARIEEIALEHGVMLRYERQHHRRIFGSLRFVDGDGIGKNKIVELAASIDNVAALEIDANLLGLGIDLCHKADIAIIDLSFSICMTLSLGQ